MEAIPTQEVSFELQLGSPSGDVTNFTVGMVKRMPGVHQAISQQLETAFQSLQNEVEISAEELFKAYSINFYWIEHAKSFLILYRNSLFEQQKADILLLEGKISHDIRDRLFRDGKTALQEASKELKELLQEAGNEMDKALVRRCRLQHNPWPVYKHQFEEIEAQVVQIAEDHQSLLGYSQNLKQIRDRIQTMVNSCQLELTTIKNTVREAGEFIKASFAEDIRKSISKVAHRMPDYQATIQEAEYLIELEGALDELYEELPERKVLILGLADTALETDDIDFQRRTKVWLKSEVLPLVYEIWELTDLRRRSAQLTFINVGNWARTLSDSKSKDLQIDGDAIFPLFTEQEEGSIQAIANLKRLLNLVSGRFEESLQAHRAYTHDRPLPFLSVDGQSTIERLRTGQNKFVRSITGFIKEQRKRFKTLLRRLEREESLSNSEKIVRRIRERTGDQDNQQYTSIFLTSGFVGTSFTVGRQEELVHVKQVIEDWRNGFRGSVLVTGERYSGKSLFAELVSSRFFPTDTIRLEANSILTVDGRKFSTGHDLGDVLEQILKYRPKDRCMILIDDLESWWTEAYPVHDNAKVLSRFANQHQHFFFVATMGNSLLNHLSQNVNLHQEFHSEINMDRVSSQMIKDAILVRHGATHKQLVNVKGEPVNPQQFRKVSQAIYAESRGNIGEALNLWAHSTWRISDDEVTNRFNKGHDLPDFLESDLGVILATVLLLRSTNEFQLRRMFGPAFSNRYAPVVRRLLGVGVLQRGIDQRLQIHPALVNRLGQILEGQGYLKYNQ